MTPLAAAVLSVLVAQPAWSGDAKDTPAQRRALLTPVAQAVADVSSDSADIAALVTLAWHETRLARYVIEGRCKDGPPGAQCDRGRARSPWQVWPWCKEAWRYADGSPASLRGGAKCALQMLGWARKSCEAKGSGEGWVAAFRGYRSLRCDELDAPKRFATFRRISAEVTTAIAGRV